MLRLKKYLNIIKMFVISGNNCLMWPEEPTVTITIK